MVEIEGLGSVKLMDHMGGALSVVNCARASLGKFSSSLAERDKKLLRYLIANEHTSPFRHVHFSFHIRCPLFVLRQWNKHQVGCAWNEQSGRYVEFDPVFGQLEWRAQSPSIKQGSLDSIDSEVGLQAQAIYTQAIKFSYDSYQKLLDMGVCKEQARTLLPQSLITECWWSCSLHALLHFLDLRLDSHSQREMQLFAQAIKEEAFSGDDELSELADFWLWIGSEIRSLKSDLKKSQNKV